MSKIRFMFVLVRPKYPGNIGHTARAIKNFGFTDLIIISKKNMINEEAIIRAAHARDIIESTKIYESLESFIDAEKPSFIIGTTARLGGDSNPRRNAVLSPNLRTTQFPPGKIAVLFGNEESGLTNEELSVCDFLVTIPTSEIYPSMNLSHAVSIIAYELSINLELSRPLPYRASTLEEREILLKYIRMLIEILYSDKNQYQKEIYYYIVRNMVSRAFITGREVHTLIGFFKRIIAKVKGLNKLKYGN